MISDSEILFWMSLGSVSISRQSKAIKLCGSVSEVWNQFISNDKLKQLFDDKYDILKRYRSEQFIGDCLERLVKSGIKVTSIYNPFYGKLLRQPEVAAYGDRFVCSRSRT